MGSGWLHDCCMIYKNQVTRHRANFPAGVIEVTFLSLYFPVESSLERLQASGTRQQRSRFLSPPVSWRAFYQNSRNLYFWKKNKKTKKTTVPVASTLEVTLQTHHHVFGWSMACWTSTFPGENLGLMLLIVCVKWQVAPEVEGSPSIRYFSSFYPPPISSLP